MFFWNIVIFFLKFLKQVEVGLECSALKSSNISEVIYCAQRVVLFPLAPLYDFTEKVYYIILKNIFLFFPWLIWENFI